MKLTNPIAAFYLGCKVQCIFPEEVVVATMTSVSEEWMAFDGQIPDYYFDAEEDENQGNGFKVKFILRRLQDMTEQEAIELFINKWPEKEYQERFSNVFVGLLSADNSRPVRFDFKSNRDTEPMRNNLGTLSFNSFSPTQWQWLCSHHFDLFGLIDSGEALDKNTLQS